MDEEECKVELPGFWAAIAAVLWPGYWDPKVTVNSSNIIISCFTRLTGCVLASVRHLRMLT